MRFEGRIAGKLTVSQKTHRHPSSCKQMRRQLQYMIKAMERWCTHSGEHSSVDETDDEPNLERANEQETRSIPTTPQHRPRTAQIWPGLTAPHAPKMASA